MGLSLKQVEQRWTVSLQAALVQVLTATAECKNRHPELHRKTRQHVVTGEETLGQASLPDRQNSRI